MGQGFGFFFGGREGCVGVFFVGLVFVSLGFFFCDYVPQQQPEHSTKAKFLFHVHAARDYLSKWVENKGMKK